MPKLGVVQDVETRWSSTYLMLERLQKIRNPLTKTLKVMLRRDLLLSESDWNTIRELIVVLQPFAHATV